MVNLPAPPTRHHSPVAFRGAPGYKTRVFTDAICSVPHETEIVVSKGAPPRQEPQASSSPTVIVPAAASPRGPRPGPRKKTSDKEMPWPS
jgi:hypothetical protein